MRLLLIYTLILLLVSCGAEPTETQIKSEEEISPIRAGLAPSDELYQTIKRMDSLYFSAQNACDLEMYAYHLDEDFEFFHDVAGLTDSKEDEMASMAIFCGEEQRSRQPLRRQLTEGTLQVFPMNNYGAMQQAEHTFHLQIPDGSEKVVGQGRFIALWKLDGNEWKLARVVSYDHQSLAEIELADETLDLYVGDYTFSDRIVNIKKEGKLLRVTDVVDGEPGWTKELLPEAENIFYLNFENVQYEFVKDGPQITDLIIFEGGEIYEEGTRNN